VRREEGGGGGGEGGGRGGGEEVRAVNACLVLVNTDSRLCLMCVGGCV